jgi:hypothetical protein
LPLRVIHHYQYLTALSGTAKHPMMRGTEPVRAFYLAGFLNAEKEEIVPRGYLGWRRLEYQGSMV